MSTCAGLLNNVRLHETCLYAADYNKLPPIDDMREASEKNAKAHAILLGVIARHGLANTFSLHLVHKQFDIPEGYIMVYEKVNGGEHSEFVLCSPRIPQKCDKARGLYFKAAPGGNMAAYEFTTEPGADLSAHADFVAEFASTVLEHGAQDVFALTAMPISPQDNALTEFVVDQVLSTVLVPGADLLPTRYVTASTSTDWAATANCAEYADDSVPGIDQLNCTRTRSQRNLNVPCSRNRTGDHLGHAPDLLSGEGPIDQVLTIDGEALQEGTEPHAIISRALQLFEAV